MGEGMSLDYSSLPSPLAPSPRAPCAALHWVTVSPQLKILLETLPLVK